jgi:hypothetical protein
MMGICWSWAFGPESGATYVADLQWQTYSTSIISETAADYLYTYSGSLTRYSAGFRGDATNIMRPPDKAVANWQPGSGGTELQGWVATPIKRDGLTTATGSRQLIRIQTTTSSGAASTIDVESVSGTGVLQLRMSNIFQGSSPVLDLSVWNYLALKWDMTTTTHTAEFFIDGVSQVSGSLAGRTGVISAVYFSLSAVGSANNRWLIGQIIVYDDATDAGETPYYVTRVSPNADGTNVGTWNPTTTTDHASVTDPFNAATYTQEATPSPNDLVEVLINAGGNDIGTQLGITPSSVQNVTLHTYSTGQLITARAELRDSAGSASVTNGPTESIDPTSTTYAVVSADAPAGGGSWTGASQPAYVYKVITT